MGENYDGTMGVCSICGDDWNPNDGIVVVKLAADGTIQKPIETRRVHTKCQIDGPSPKAPDPLIDGWLFIPDTAPEGGAEPALPDYDDDGAGSPSASKATTGAVELRADAGGGYRESAPEASIAG